MLLTAIFIVRQRSRAVSEGALPSELVPPGEAFDLWPQPHHRDGHPNARREGVVIDGGTRDLDELSDDTSEGLPVFARFFNPVGPPWLDAENNVPIRVGRDAHRRRDDF